ncbi:putative glutathione-S-transferase theta, GST [Aspergillus coremiiformis]|uniref:Putative glutathione-S-transferase theta, GST n=1 Tax=Aspergillus coremiiformis TaxID=138285 RepID=A0A5N6Z9S2_9EURO|nr:putative glutathione-S-transferase theta, GST [Aspergillus coremiiformis]
MNVFQEQRGMISLFASRGKKEGAIVAIILEELKLPYDLHLIDKPEESDVTSLPVLKNLQSDGEHVDLSGFDNVVSYLIERYDTMHEVSYKKGSREDEEVKNWIASLSPEPKEAHPEQHRFNLDADDGVPFARKAINLYLHLEQHLQKSHSHYLVGKKCTLADLLHLPYVAAASSAGLDLERFPELTTWYNRVYQRPAVQKGVAAVHLKI